MKIILLTDIPRVGTAGEIKEVAPGFARNVLLKNEQAQLATPENLTQLKSKQTKFDREHAAKKVELEKLNQRLSSLKLVIKEKANEQGKLFAGIDKKRITLAIQNNMGSELDPNVIKLKSPLKEIGTEKIKYALSSELTGEFTLVIKKQ